MKKVVLASCGFVFIQLILAFILGFIPLPPKEIFLVVISVVCCVVSIITLGYNLAVTSKLLKNLEIHKRNYGLGSTTRIDEHGNVVDEFSNALDTILASKHNYRGFEEPE